ncbi:MAG: YfcE family phosphodiesterase [Candidatus Omnitrophica bacterium]|nr:YfcE family phosphodiesterase [Candidatus Omnitrophota bacterium]
MKIGVISDTHIPMNCDRLPEKVLKELKNCDLIVHAGDIVEMSLIYELERYAPVKAVSGNMDGRDVKARLPITLLFDAGGKKIGVVHGDGSGEFIPEKLTGYFDGVPDIIIFGHSHKPVNSKYGNVLYFNPGSATDRVCAACRSFGVIEIENGEIKAEIIKL